MNIEPEPGAEMLDLIGYTITMACIIGIMVFLHIIFL